MQPQHQSCFARMICYHGTTVMCVSWILSHITWWLNGSHQEWPRTNERPTGAKSKWKPCVGQQHCINTYTHSRTYSLALAHLYEGNYHSTSGKTVLSVVHMSACIPWHKVGMIHTQMLENDLALENATYNCPEVNTGSSKWMLTFSNLLPWALLTLMAHARCNANWWQWGTNGSWIPDSARTSHGITTSLFLWVPRRISASVILH